MNNHFHFGETIVFFELLKVLSFLPFFCTKNEGTNLAA